MKHKLIRFILKTICRHLVKQGHRHGEYILMYYEEMARAAVDEFTEDSPLSLQSYLNQFNTEATINAYNRNETRNPFDETREHNQRMLPRS